MKSGRSADPTRQRLAVAFAGSALASLLVCGAAGSASAPGYDRQDALRQSQAAIGGELQNQVLRDVDGNAFDLASLRGKPLVISMIYTSCHHVCPTTTTNLAQAVDIAQEALGDDAFSVISVGFDWVTDTPERMRVFAAERRIRQPRWHFLAGDEASIGGMSRDLGFLFFPSAKGFDHLTQTTIVDGKGLVYRQVYGTDLAAQSLVEPLKELVFDTPRDASLINHWVDTFRLFCTVYDPNTGRYRFDYSIAMTIFVGTVCLGAIAGFVLREWRHAR